MGKPKGPKKRTFDDERSLLSSQLAGAPAARRPPDETTASTTAGGDSIADRMRAMFDKRDDTRDGQRDDQRDAVEDQPKGKSKKSKDKSKDKSARTFSTPHGSKHTNDLTSQFDAFANFLAAQHAFPTQPPSTQGSMSQFQHGMHGQPEHWMHDFSGSTDWQGAGGAGKPTGSSYYSGGGSSGSSSSSSGSKGMDVYIVSKKGDMLGPWSVPNSDWDWWVTAKEFYPASDGKMYIPEDRVEFSYGTPRFNACTFDATKAYLEARWGRKLDSTDKDWLSQHPLSTEGGIPMEYTAICLQELVAPYGMAIARMRVRKGLVVMSDEDKQFALALGCNPIGFQDHSTDNKQFVELTGGKMTLEEANKLFRFEFADVPYATSIIGEAGWTNQQGVSTGFGGGHARFLPPRGTYGNWKVSIQMAPDHEIAYNTPIVYPAYEPRKGPATLLMNKVKRLDGKPVAVKTGGWWYSVEEAEDRDKNPGKYKNNGWSQGSRTRIPSTQEEIDAAKASGDASGNSSGASSGSSQTSSTAPNSSNSSSSTSVTKPASNIPPAMRKTIDTIAGTIEPSPRGDAKSRFDHYVNSFGTVLFEEIPGAEHEVQMRWLTGTRTYREAWLEGRRILTVVGGEQRVSYAVKYPGEIDATPTGNNSPSQAALEFYFETIRPFDPKTLGANDTLPTPSASKELSKELTVIGHGSHALVKCALPRMGTGATHYVPPNKIVQNTHVCEDCYADAWDKLACPNKECNLRFGTVDGFGKLQVPELIDHDRDQHTSMFQCPKCNARITVDEKKVEHQEAFPELVTLSQQCIDILAEAKDTAEDLSKPKSTPSTTGTKPKSPEIEWADERLATMLKTMDQSSKEVLAKQYQFTSVEALERYAEGLAKPVTPVTPSTTTTTTKSAIADPFGPEADALAATLAERWSNLTPAQKKSVANANKVPFTDWIEDYLSAGSATGRETLKALYSSLPSLRALESTISDHLPGTVEEPETTMEAKTEVKTEPSVEATVETPAPDVVEPVPSETPTEITGSTEAAEPVESTPVQS